MVGGQEIVVDEPGGEQPGRKHHGGDGEAVEAVVDTDGAPHAKTHHPEALGTAFVDPGDEAEGDSVVEAPSFQEVNIDHKGKDPRELIPQHNEAADKTHVKTRNNEEDEVVGDEVLEAIVEHRKHCEEDVSIGEGKDLGGLSLQLEASTNEADGGINFEAHGGTRAGKHVETSAEASSGGGEKIVKLAICKVISSSSKSKHQKQDENKLQMEAEKAFKSNAKNQEKMTLKDKLFHQIFSVSACQNRIFLTHLSEFNIKKSSHTHGTTQSTQPTAKPRKCIIIFIYPFTLLNHHTFFTNFEVQKRTSVFSNHANKAFGWKQTIWQDTGWKSGFGSMAICKMLFGRCKLPQGVVDHDQIR